MLERYKQLTTKYHELILEPDWPYKVTPLIEEELDPTWEKLTEPERWQALKFASDIYEKKVHGRR